LFLVKFQASALNESVRLLVKLSCKSAFENLDAARARAAICFFATNIAVDQEVIVVVIVISRLYLHAADGNQHKVNLRNSNIF